MTYRELLKMKRSSAYAKKMKLCWYPIVFVVGVIAVAILSYWGWGQ